MVYLPPELNDQSLVDKVQELRSLESPTEMLDRNKMKFKFAIRYIGTNSRLTDFECAMCILLDF